MKVVVVVGARPNFMKAAPILRAIADANAHGSAIVPVLVHTGQHYDSTMSDAFFSDLSLPSPNIHLGVAPVRMPRRPPKLWGSSKVFWRMSVPIRSSS